MATTKNNLIDMVTGSPEAIENPQERLIAKLAKSKKMRIALLVIGEMGHAIPIIRLASALEERGHEVAIMTFSYAKEKAEKMMKQNNLKGELIIPFECSRNWFFRGSDTDKTSMITMPS